MNSAEERVLERLAAVAQNQLDYAPLLRELAELGFEVDSIAALKRFHNYKAALPTLIQLLTSTSNQDMKRDIASALALRSLKNTEVPQLLVREFELAQDPTGYGLRASIGDALRVLASDKIADDLLRFAVSRQYGGARALVVLGLSKLKDPRTVDVLLSLLDDEDVVGHALDALGKLRVKEARPRIEPFLEHPTTMIRNEAKKALARIDKAP